MSIAHPLAAGYAPHYFSLKTRATAYEVLDGYGTVAHLPKGTKPFAGFSGDKAVDLQSESLLVGTEKYGRGSVVYLVDNPLYRNFGKTEIVARQCYFLVNVALILLFRM